VELTVILYLALLLVVAGQRLAELHHSHSNAERARAAGAVEAGAGHYPWMVVLHSTFLASCALETWLLARPFLPWLAVPAAALLLGATVLRYSAIRALGERWTTRVFLWPGRPLVETGPYRYLRHPNYVAVAIEIAALPLVHTAWVTAILFSALNAWLLAVRLDTERRVLTEAADGGNQASLGVSPPDTKGVAP
jgi:methyltransferase